MENISVQQVKDRLDAGEKLNLIDVRQPEEVAEDNIGGVSLPLGKVQSMEIDDIEHLKDEEVILYCRSGQRSAMASLFLEQQGFTNVKNMAGGMKAYREL